MTNKCIILCLLDRTQINLTQFRVDLHLSIQFSQRKAVLYYQLQKRNIPLERFYVPIYSIKDHMSHRVGVFGRANLYKSALYL